MAAAGFDKALADVGCAKLGDVTSKEKTKVFLNTMDRLFATNTGEYWLKILRGVDIVSAPINTLLEASVTPMSSPIIMLLRLTTPGWVR